MSEKNQDEMLKEHLSKIKNTIVVLSGKGGVGKSTVAVNLAVSLSIKGLKVGLLDVDVHGPSVPTLLGLEGVRLEGDGEFMYPVRYNENLKVISTGFMIEDATSPIIWRGPMKMGFIKQTISDVLWEDLDYLIVDCPPGTGDEPLSVIQTLNNVTGAIIVTTPQKLAVVDVKKSVNFCKKLNTPIFGVIENMSVFIWPKFGDRVEIFKSGGGKTMATEMDVPFLGKIPLEASIVDAGDLGKPFVKHYANTQTAKDIDVIIEKIVK